MRVLLLEDNPDSRRFLRTVLEHTQLRDLECIEASSVNDALEKLRSGRFDLLLIDLNLPDSQGLDTVRTLEMFVENIPTIVLSASKDEEMSLKALHFGVQDYLVKGEYDGKSLFRTISYSIERFNNRRVMKENNRRLEETLSVLSREYKLTEALSDLYRTLFIPHAELKAIALAVHRKILELTGSKLAFVSVLEPETRRNIGLAFSVDDRGVSIEKPAMMPDWSAPDESGNYPGMWGRALNEGKGFFINADMKGTAKMRYPPGHLEIEQYLVVPVLIGKNPVGTLSVANCGRDYTEADLAILNRIGEYYALAIQKVRHEDEIRKSNEFLNLLINVIPDNIIVNDRSGKYLLVNRALADLYGLTPADIIGKAESDIQPDSSIVAKHREENKVVLDNNIDIHIPLETHRYPTGISRSYTTVKRPIINATGMTEGILTVSRDITALAEEKERLAITLRSIAEGVVTTDASGVVMMINRAAEELTGFTAAEAVGKKISDMYVIVDPKTGTSRENKVMRVLGQTGGAESTGQEMLVTKNGRRIIVEDVASPLLDSEGRLMGSVLVFRDVTEKTRMEEELVKIEKLDSIGVLAGGIAHDFNNILTKILGFVSLLKLNIRQADEDLSYVEGIEKAIAQAKTLTQQLLVFSKGGQPVKETMTLDSVIRETVDFSMRGSNILAVYDIPDNLRPVDVDKGQISQVIQNIVINAEQAMPNGGKIFITAANVDLTDSMHLPLESGLYVTVKIADTGPGIPSEILDKIFDPFFTTKAKGNGLGLAVVYSIIKKHNGYIDVKSVLGEGTSFTIYLPVSVSDVRTYYERQDIIIYGRGHVLMMDDEEMILQIASQMLTKMGFTVETAREGHELIQLYMKNRTEGRKVDVVIMDLTIPGGMGGRETIRKLLQIDPDVKAIVSSGYSTDPIMSDYKAYGFCGVVAKPYKLNELGLLLNDVIQGF